MTLSTASLTVYRIALYFATLPTGDSFLATTDGGGAYAGPYFQASDGKVYAALDSGTVSIGSTGIGVITGRWYVLDCYVDHSSATWTVDVRVDGIPLGQATKAIAAANISSFKCGIINKVTSPPNITAEIFYDDVLISRTSADYPIGKGYVNHFVPTADGTHNVAGAADFKRGAAGTDILNSTTDSYLLIDDIPMDDSTPDTDDYINAIAPPNATDYVEHIFGPAPGVVAPVVGPRAVEAIVAYHQAGTGAGSSQFRLNDNGTEDTIVALSGAGVTTTRYSRKHYATMVGGGAWTAARFNALRHRFGFVGDANPDQYFDCAMIEAEFEDRFGKQTALNQAVKRANHW